MKDFAIRVVDFFASIAIWLSLAAGLIGFGISASGGDIFSGAAIFAICVITGCFLCAGWSVLSGIYHNGIEQNRISKEQNKLLTKISTLPEFRLAESDKANSQV